MLPIITVEGRLTADPQLRFTPTGMAICSFSIACQDRKKEGDNWVDGDKAFFRISVFKKLGENCAESLSKGDLVVVVGKQKQDEYTDKNGDKQTSYQNITANIVAPSLAFVTARINRAERSSSSTSSGGGGQQQADSTSDEPPF